MFAACRSACTDANRELRIGFGASWVESGELDLAITAKEPQFFLDPNELSVRVNFGASFGTGQAATYVYRRQ